MKIPEARYFLALIPPEPLFEQIHQFKIHCRDNYQTRAALRSPPHLTLHMPFLWPLKKEEVLVSSISALARELPNVTLYLNGFGCFSPRVIFVKVNESVDLRRLQHAVIRHCRQSLNLFNADYRDLPFHPHITIAFRDLKKSNFPDAWREFGAKEFNAKFDATSLCLLKHDGNVWREFQHFQFRDAAIL